MDEQNKVIEILLECENAMRDAKFKDFIDKIKLHLKKDYYDKIDFIIEDIFTSKIDKNKEEIIKNTINKLKPSIDKAERNWWDRICDGINWL